MKQPSIDVNDVIEELTFQVAGLARENAILKAQIKALQTKDKNEKVKKNDE